MKTVSGFLGAIADSALPGTFSAEAVPTPIGAAFFVYTRLCRGITVPADPVGSDVGVGQNV